MNPTRERLHGFDALRGFALLLGVVLHSAMSFLPGMQIWVIADSTRSPILSAIFFLIHTFRMLLFFVLAGFFARMSLQRLGWQKFIVDRLKRIAVPLIFGLPILFFCVLLVLTWIANIQGRPQAPFTISSISPEAFPLIHLWFLYLLLIFYSVGLLARATLGRLTWLKTVLDTVFSLLLRSWLPIVGLPLMLSLYLFPNWLYWFGIPTPDTTLYPNLPALIGYGTAFLFGYGLHRQIHWLEVLKKRWAINLFLAVSGSLACLLVFGTVPVFTPPSEKLGLAALYSLTGWSWTLALLGIGLRFFSSFNATQRYFSEAAYWIYLIHLPLVMALQTLYAPLEWAWWIKFPSIVVATIGLTLLTYQLLVRYSFIGVVLNGKRTQS